MDKKPPQMAEEERDACVLLYRKVGSIIDREDYDVILNTLCFIMGELGTELDVDKREYIAKIVEQVSGSYDLFLLAQMKPEGEA